MVASQESEVLEVDVDRRGRPCGYRPEFAERIRLVAQTGATEREMAEHLNVSENTFKRWTHKYAELWVAMKSGKEACDDRVVHALYRRAVGYTYDSEKIFQHKGEPVVVPCVEHVPPSESAATFWLKNRRPKEWKDKTEVESTITHEAGDSIMSLIGSMRAEQQSTVDNGPTIDAEIIDQPAVSEISQAPAVVAPLIVTEEEVC